MPMVGDRGKGVRLAHYFSLSFCLVVTFIILFWWTDSSLSIENEECLECHGRQDIFRMNEEERLKMVVSTPEKEEVWKGKLALYVDYNEFRSSVHQDLKCVDCHAEVREIPHLQRMGMVKCDRCHREVVRQYDESKHAKVSAEICFGCHDPHSSIPFKNLNVEQRQTICIKCHDPRRGHDWLPQRETHIKYLECTMCHAPQAERGLVFYLQRVDRKGTVKRLAYGEVAKLLGMENPNLVTLFDSDGNGVLESREVLSFLNTMQQRSLGDRIELGVMVLVLKPSHNYTDKGTKAKDCSLCHSTRAPFYKKLIMEIPEQGGSIRTLPLDKSILVGIHPIPVTSDFYLLGESKISRRDIADILFLVRKVGYKWLDVIGIVFILGGLGFVGLHGLIRILTLRMRKKRKNK